jgi:hypothetical protein
MRHIGSLRSLASRSAKGHFMETLRGQPPPEAVKTASLPPQPPAANHRNPVRRNPERRNIPARRNPARRNTCPNNPRAANNAHRPVNNRNDHPQNANTGNTDPRHAHPGKQTTRELGRRPPRRQDSRRRRGAAPSRRCRRRRIAAGDTAPLSGGYARRRTLPTPRTPAG